MAERKIPASYFASLEDARTSLREESLMALEQQLAAVEWLRSDNAEPALVHFIEAYGHTKLFDSDARTSTAVQTQARWLRDRTLSVVKDAPTYFVSRDMTEMVKMAAEEMPREGITPIDLLTDSGFLYFHHPIDIVGPGMTSEDSAEMRAQGLDPDTAPITKTQTLGVRAIAWTHDEYVGRPDGSRGPGVAYFLFMDAEPAWEKSDADEQDISLHEFKRMFGPIMLYDFSGWTYGLDWEVVPYEESADPLATPPKVHPVVDQVRKLLLSTWRMLSQKLVMLETQRPPRYLRRRANRIIPGDGDVTVIRLRREYHPEGGEDQAAMNAQAGDQGSWYNHRFLVRGHWRRQPYGEGGLQRKLIWVAPFVKGDESLPFVAKSRIYSLEQ